VSDRLQCRRFCTHQKYTTTLMFRVPTVASGSNWRQWITDIAEQLTDRQSLSPPTWQQRNSNHYGQSRIEEVGKLLLFPFTFSLHLLPPFSSFPFLISPSLPYPLPWIHIGVCGSAPPTARGSRKSSNGNRNLVHFSLTISHLTSAGTNFVVCRQKLSAKSKFLDRPTTML